MSNQNKDETKVGNRVPLHYETRTYDVIDVCKWYNLNFNKGNVIKYVCRSDKKDNEVQDLLKAIDYLNREIDFLNNNNK